MHAPVRRFFKTSTALHRVVALVCACAGLGTGAALLASCGSHEAEDRKAMDEESKSAVGSPATKSPGAPQNASGPGDATSRMAVGKKPLDALLRSGGDATVRPGGGANDSSRNAATDGATDAASGKCRAPLTLVSDMQAGRERRLLVGTYDTACAEGLTPVISVHAPLSLRIVPPVECVSGSGTYELRCRANPDDVLLDGQVSVEVQLAEGTGADVRALIGFAP